MEMVKVRAADLIGRPLDWAVAKCVATVKHNAILDGVTMCGWWISGLVTEDPNCWVPLERFNPSTNWARGGLLVDCEDIEFVSFRRDNEHGLVERIHRATVSPEFQFQNYRSRMSRYTCDGPTKLVAAMRCYITWQLGEEVEVPKELL